jgi:hypothetical protein
MDNIAVSSKIDEHVIFAVQLVNVGPFDREVAGLLGCTGAQVELSLHAIPGIRGD